MMSAEQKQAARNLIDDFKDAGNEWDEAAVASHMTALLQEMVDAPEAEPVARVTGYYAGYLSIATVDGRVLPTGTALYTAPQPQKLSDERILEVYAEVSGRPVTMGKNRIIDFARAVEREILGCGE